MPKKTVEYLEKNFLEKDVPEIESPELPILTPVPLPDVAPAEPEKERIPFRIFRLIAPLKLDQLGGFESYARTQNLGAMTYEAWIAELKKFQSLPVL